MDGIRARLQAATRIGDPAADRVIETVIEPAGAAGWERVHRALDGDAGRADLAVRELLAPVAAPPAWVDPDLVEAGAVAFWRVGSPTLLVTATYGSVAFGFRSARLSRALAGSAQPEATARQRVAETTRWALTATRPGSMAPWQEGWVATVRLRLARAAARRYLRRAPWWRHEAWGVPWSAADQFATTIGGSCVIAMRAMADLGVRFTPAEEEAVCHLWRWIAYVAGVPEPLLPAGAAATQAWVDAALTLDPGPTEDGARLMRTLLEADWPPARLLPGAPGAVARAASARVAAGFTRRWLGDETADRLAVPRVTPAPLVPLLRPLQRARDVVRASGVVSDRVLSGAEVALARRLLAVQSVPLVPLRPETEPIAELSRP